jgi:hypothetical protein
MHNMNADAFIQCRATHETKSRFAALARNRDLSESALLKQLVEVALAGAGFDVDQPASLQEPVLVRERLSVRLAAADDLLLRERARARAVPTSRYVTLLVRSHLRNIAPLPTSELEDLRRSVAEVGALGRNLNQIARAVNRGEISSGPTRAELQGMLKTMTGLREKFKAVIAANQISWRIGHDPTTR